MEDRLLLSVVTNVNDSGAGSLRQAITDVNAGLGGGTITFNIAGSGVQTISPLSALPTITVPVNIDATTQPGYAGAPLVQISGVNAGAAADGLVISGGGSAVVGLAINQFGGNGIRLTTVGGDTIRSDYIGTNTAGTTAMANGGAGILITDGSNGDTIGGLTAGSGNLISGNTGGGININASSAATPASGTIIEGNLIGTDVTGLKALGNGGQGINVNNGPNTQVGGTAAAARNIIAGNTGNGVQLGAGSGTVVLGNYIGTDKTGAKALGNAGAGVFFNGGSNDTIGGTASGASNVISGNGANGIGSAGAASNVETIQANFIGTDPTGTVAVANSGNGIAIWGPTNVLIGGATAAARNIISGNTQDGINTFGTTTGLLVEGNYIGVDASGTKGLGNGGNGVNLFSNNNTIGGPVAADGNVIAFNGTGTTGAGVNVILNSSGNAVLSNSIYNNAGLGINLGGQGNNNQSFPVLNAATVNGSGTTVTGTFNSRPLGTYTLQFFANTTPDRSGFGQGRTYLGSWTVQTDSNGNATFTANGLAAAAPGSFISATATDSASDTSQFAQDITTIGTADLGVTLSTSTGSAIVGGQLVYTIVVSNAGPTLARNVNAIFNLSSGETVVGTTTTQGTVNVGASTVGASLNNIAAGSNATVTITVQEGVAAVPSVTDTVSVGTVDGDPNPNNNSASATTPVSAVADLAVAFNATPPVVLAGTNLTYTIVVTNNGPSPATGVTLTDTLPAGVAFVSATDSLGNTGTLSGNTVTDSIGALASGGRVTVTIVITTSSATAASITDTATVAANVSDSNSSNNTASATTSVTPVADLAVAITPSASTVQVGTNLTYKVVATNNGPSPATGVTLTDTLPAGVAFVSATDSLGNTLTPAGGTLTDNVGGLAALGSVTLTVVVTPGAANVLSVTDTASVGAQQADLVAANNTATVKTTVTPAADMAVSVSGPSGPVSAGSTVTYTVTVANNGPSPATGVVLTDVLPAGVAFSSATDSVGNTLIPAGNTLTDTLGGMAAGSSVTLSILVATTGSTPATIQDSARVAADQSDTNPANNAVSASTTVNPVADLAVALAPPADPLLLNQPATYVFTVVNNGPSSATGVTLTVPLPSGIPFTFNSATDSQGHKLTPSGGDIVDAIGDLDPGLPQTLTLVVTPTGAGTLTEGSASDLARVKANETDPNATNNSLSPTSNTVSAVADLSVVLSADQSQLVRGATLTYTATVTNNGPSPATGVTLVDSLPSGATVVSAPGATLRPDGTLAESLGTLASGASTTVTIVVVPTAPGTVTNSVTASANEIDPIQANNMSSVTTSVLDLSGSLEFASPSYSVAEDGGTASIVVRRVGGSQGAVTVDLTVGGGTATPGLDYTPPTTSTLTFGDGVSSQTITIPVLNNPFDSHDETLDITLSNPTGGASLGSQTSTTLTIRDIDPNHTAPTIQDVRLFGPANAVNDVELFFSEPLNPAAASNPNNYQIIPAAANGFVAAGTAPIGVSQAAYDPSGRTVSLTPAVPLAAGHFYMVRVIGSGVVDLGGNGLAGDGTGTPGTDFTSYFGRGTKLSYVDQSGHLVSLSLTGGGVIDLSRSPNGQAQTLEVVAPVAGRSVLSGSVRGGSTTIGAITGLGQFGQVRVQMKTPPFLVSHFPFRLTTISPPAEDGVVGAPVSTPPKKKVVVTRLGVRAAIPSGPRVRASVASRLNHR